MHRIEKVLKEKGLTAKDLAANLGVSAPAVSKIINGNPTLAKLEEVAKALGVPLVELIEERDFSYISCPHCEKPIQIDVVKK